MFFFPKKLIWPVVIASTLVLLLAGCSRFQRTTDVTPGFTEAEVTASNLMNQAAHARTPEQQQRAYQQVVTLYTQALQERPNNAVTYYNNRGIAYMELHKYLAAIDDFTAGLQIAPNDASLYWNRGLAYEHLNQLEAAVTDYEAYLDSTAPDTSHVRQKRRREIQLKIERLQEAMQQQSSS